MESIIRNERLLDATVAGNKAARLAALQQAGFAVPAFFVIDPQSLREVARRDELERDIRVAVADVAAAGELLAVRSSSAEEDGSEASFAGQFDSFLRVAAERVYEHAQKVVASAASEHVGSYRVLLGKARKSTVPAVLVQKMIEADCAGVAFAADPVSGNADCAVVAAVRGTGESLVSGAAQGDTWRVHRNSTIVERIAEGEVAVLDDEQVREVAALVRDVSRALGVLQDIEWAIAGDRLYLLQSRDITTLSAAAQHGDGAGTYALWDNSNIVESYGGVTTPLTFSVARSAYQNAYRQLGQALGIGQRTIAANTRIYEQMIGLIQGRVYYNLLNWYRLLMQTPGYRFNGRFMEQMMGVTQGLPADAIPEPGAAKRFSRLRASLSLVRVAWRLVSGLVLHNRRVRRFHRRIDTYLQPVELQRMSLAELIDYYEALQAKVIPAWDTPLMNDLYCMIFHGALRQLSHRWLGDGLAEIHNELVAGEAGIISLEPVQRMQAMATIARRHPTLVAALCEAPLNSIRTLLPDTAEFEALLSEYLDKFGDRCLDELKLESRTLNDDPLPLLRAVGQLARKKEAPVSGADPRLAAAAMVEKALAGHVLRRGIYSLLLGRTRARVRDRENLRFERTRVYGRVRSIFVEIGKRLQAGDVIGQVDDIFYLDVAEITGLIRGTGVSGNVAGIVAARRREFADYAAGDDPPRRFLTCGPAQLGSSMRALPASSDTAQGGDARRGQACSQGIVRGPVRIVRDPRNNDFKNGEILVAQRTDPGWVTIFPLVSGMIMERGSLLSHSAIVARELGIPAVVGVEDACQWLRDGDWVELDGAAGTIRRLAATDRAA